MNVVRAIVTGTGFGALAMYLFDPDVGRRRRAVGRDKMTQVQKRAKEAALVTARDLKNRMSGLVAEGRSRFSEGDISNEVLSERVRSKLGFLVRHPSAIEVQVSDGRVIMSGPVLSDEVEQLIAGVRSVRGVRDVENRLDVHVEPGSVPELQGDKPKPTGQPIDLLQRHWAPSTKFLVGSAGFLLPLVVARKQMTIASSIALAGLGLLAYGLSEVNGSSRDGQPREDNLTEPLGGWDIDM